MVALLALLALAPAAALGAQPRASFNDVEDEVMCDTCNVPLNIAESDRADQERAAIRRLIARGLTKQQILAELEEHLRARASWPSRRTAASASRSGGCRSPSWRAWSRCWRRCCRAGAGAGATAATIDGPRARAPALSAADERRLDEDLARYDV